MEIKYEVHSIENSQGTGESRPFIQLRNIPAMTARQFLRIKPIRARNKTTMIIKATGARKGKARQIPDAMTDTTTIVSSMRHAVRMKKAQKKPIMTMG